MSYQMTDLTQARKKKKKKKDDLIVNMVNLNLVSVVKGVAVEHISGRMFAILNVNCIQTYRLDQPRLKF